MLRRLKMFLAPMAEGEGSGSAETTTTVAPTGQAGGTTTAPPTGQPPAPTPTIDMAGFVRSQAEHAQALERFKGERAAFDAQRKELEPVIQLRDRVAKYKDSPELALDDLGIDYAALTKRMAGRPTASPEAAEARAIAQQTQLQLQQLQYQTAVSTRATHLAPLLDKYPLTRGDGVTAQYLAEAVIRNEMAVSRGQAQPMTAEAMLADREKQITEQTLARIEAHPELYTAAQARVAARDAKKASDAAAAALAAKPGTKSAPGVISQSAQTTPAAGGVKLSEAERKARAVARLRAGKEAAK